MLLAGVAFALAQATAMPTSADVAKERQVIEREMAFSREEWNRIAFYDFVQDTRASLQLERLLAGTPMDGAGPKPAAMAEIMRQAKEVESQIPRLIRFITSEKPASEKPAPDFTSPMAAVLYALSALGPINTHLMTIVRTDHTRNPVANMKLAADLLHLREVLERLQKPF